MGSRPNRSDGNGGAIYALCKTLTVRTDTWLTSFDVNSAGDSGGAIYFSPDPTTMGVFTTTNVEYNTNTAGFSGGAVHSSDGTTNVSGCLFNNNWALGANETNAPFYGGGLFSDGVALTVSNSTFFRNNALTNGGGLAILCSNGSIVSLTSLTIFNNDALANGGGIYLLRRPGADRPMIWNSIVGNNTANSGPNVFGTVASFGYNLIGDTAGSSGWSTNPILPLKPDQTGVATAGLSLLAANGGPTRTLAVPNTSLAFQRGDSGMQGANFPYNVDQRGQPRNMIVNGRPKVNVGAFDGLVANNPPAGANNAVTTPQDTAYVFAPADFNFSDPNNTPANNFLAVKISMLPFVGTLTDNGNPVAMGDFIPVSDIAAGYLKFTPPAATSGSPLTSFLFQVQRGGGGADLDPTPRTMTINVTATGVTLIDPGNQYSLAGAYVNLPLMAFGSPGDSLTFSVTGLPPGLDVNITTGVISGTIDSSAGGTTYNVIASVFDQTNGSLNWVTFTWAVT